MKLNSGFRLKLAEELINLVERNLFIIYAKSVLTAPAPYPEAGVVIGNGLSQT